jgi:hypothetical protein
MEDAGNNMFINLPADDVRRILGSCSPASIRGEPGTLMKLGENESTRKRIWDDLSFFSYARGCAHIGARLRVHHAGLRATQKISESDD